LVDYNKRKLVRACTIITSFEKAAGIILNKTKNKGTPDQLQGIRLEHDKYSLRTSKHKIYEIRCVIMLKTRDMVSINISKEMEASPEQVWNIVSDVDREPEFWYGTKSIKKNINKKDNVIEREVVIAFRNSVCREIVTLDSKKSVNIKITDGPMKGTKNIIINAIANNKTRIDVQWDIKVKGFFGMFTGIIKKHISEGTEDALERISKAAASRHRLQSDQL
jgi:ribosome-associated toxin RatA of RatAB toxin-antitoxin module